MAPARFSSFARQALAAFALLALALKVLAPPGYMLAAGALGGVKVVLCTADGAVEMTLGGEEPHENKAKAEHPCVFAVSAAPFTPTPGVWIRAPAAPFALARAPTKARDLAPGRGLAAPPPPATAPPILI
jgi:hypothetical protein